MLAQTQCNNTSKSSLKFKFTFLNMLFQSEGQAKYLNRLFTPKHHCLHVQTPLTCSFQAVLLLESCLSFFSTTTTSSGDVNFSGQMLYWNSVIVHRVNRAVWGHRTLIKKGTVTTWTFIAPKMACPQYHYANTIYPTHWLTFTDGARYQLVSWLIWAISFWHLDTVFWKLGRMVERLR